MCHGSRAGPLCGLYNRAALFAMPAKAKLVRHWTLSTLGTRPADAAPRRPATIVAVAEPPARNKADRMNRSHARGLGRAACARVMTVGMSLSDAYRLLCSLTVSKDYEVRQEPCSSLSEAITGYI